MGTQGGLFHISRLKDSGGYKAFSFRGGHEGILLRILPPPILSLVSTRQGSHGVLGMVAGIRALGLPGSRPGL